jgi:uncharacterized protein YndB with AHSA1/START domain
MIKPPTPPRPTAWRQPGTAGHKVVTDGRTGTLAFELGPDGRLVETYPDGTSFVVGHIPAWEPPRRLVLSWRHASFAPDQETELHVRFDDVEDPAGAVAQTRVVVEHFGWDHIPPEHAARHGFPLTTFQLRFAQWWQTLLRTLTNVARNYPGAPPPASAGEI